MPTNRKFFVKPNDPILIKIAPEIPASDIKSREVKKIIDQIFDACFANQKDRSKPMVVGLAAPQVGISKRIIAIDIAANGKGGVGNLKIYLNPEIIWSSKEKVDWYEGCWSTSSVCGIVARSKSVKIRAYTTDGKLVKEKYQGYTARIFQHEIDHLNGKEFVTHISDDDKLHWVKEDQFPEYRNKEAWRNWPYKCSREKWENIKGIRKISI